MAASRESLGARLRDLEHKVAALREQVAEMMKMLEKIESKVWEGQ